MRGSLGWRASVGGGLLAAVAVCWPAADARAETFVSLRNDTTAPVTVEVVEVPLDLDLDAWGRGARSIAPGETARTAWFHRHIGVTSGETFTFRQRLVVDGVEGGVEIGQRLLGEVIGSDLSISVGASSWSASRSVGVQCWDAGARQFVLAGQVVEREGLLEVGEDVVFSIEEVTLAGARDDPDQLHVLAYNIWNIPFLSDDREERAAALPAYMAPYDVIVFSEAFDEAILERLLSDCRARGFAHRTKVEFRAPGLLSSGVVILSRWPIVDEGRTYFDRSLDPDIEQTVVSKGVAYAKIVKGEGEAARAYHVFGTHTQSDSLGSGSSIRTSQLEQMRAFVEGLTIPADEPIVIAGDLNVDRHGPEYDDMKRRIVARWPERNGHGESPVNGHRFTFDTEDNPHAKTIFDLLKDKILPVDVPKLGTEQVFLDYVLSHRAPGDRIQPVEARIETRKCWPGARPLSDHYAVYGWLRYERAAVASAPARRP